MIRLTAVEIRRALARRLVRVLVALALVAIAVVAVGVYAANEELPDAADARAEERFEERVEACTDVRAQEVGLSRAEAHHQCADEVGRSVVIDDGTRVDDPRYLTALWPEGSESDAGLMIPAFLLPLVAFVAGASTIGAEWRAGTMATVLTWEPRRGTLLTAKFLAAGLVATLLGAVLTGLFGAAFLPTVLLKGSTEGAGSEWWGDATAAWARIATATGVAALLGAALASLGRNTAAAVGVGFGWLLVGEGFVRALRPGWSPWLVGENLFAFLTGLTVDVAGVTRSAAGAGLTLGLYTFLACLVALAVFERRDVAAAD